MGEYTIIDGEVRRSSTRISKQRSDSAKTNSNIESTATKSNVRLPKRRAIFTQDKANRITLQTIQPGTASQSENPGPRTSYPSAELAPVLSVLEVTPQDLPPGTSTTKQRSVTNSAKRPKTNSSVRLPRMRATFTKKKAHNIASQIVDPATTLHGKLPEPRMNHVSINLTPILSIPDDRGNVPPTGEMLQDRPQTRFYDRGLTKERVELECDKRGLGAGVTATLYRPRAEHKWWSRDEMQWQSMGHRRKLRISHCAKQMESTLGEEMVGARACQRCRDNSFECWFTQSKDVSMSNIQLTFAHAVDLRPPVVPCIRARKFRRATKQELVLQL